MASAVFLSAYAARAIVTAQTIPPALGKGAVVGFLIISWAELRLRRLSKTPRYPPPLPGQPLSQSMRAANGAADSASICQIPFPVNAAKGMNGRPPGLLESIPRRVS